MAFDDWHEGIPVGWVLNSRCGEELTPWMTALIKKMATECPGWNPSTFIVDCAQGEINALT